MSVDIPGRSGLYLVTLSNSEPISVNADRPRIAERCIKVTRANCKFGKAENLAARMKNYERTFGAHHVRFEVLAVLDNPAPLESRILDKLKPYRIRSLEAGRLNEWLHGISPEQVKAIVAQVLQRTESDDTTKTPVKTVLHRASPPVDVLTAPTDALDPAETIRLLLMLREAGFVDEHFSLVHHFPRETIESHLQYCRAKNTFRKGSNNVKVQLRLRHIAYAVTKNSGIAETFDFKRLALDAVTFFP